MDRKNDMNDIILNQLHTDIIFNGRFSNSSVIRCMAGQRDEYGQWRQSAIMSIGTLAESLARTVGADPKVAQGISYGLILGEPNFGAVGEKFLKEKIPNYNKSELGLALIKVILHGINLQRVEQIFQSVEKLLSESKCETEEEKAAMIAYMIYRNTKSMAKNQGFMRVGVLSNITQNACENKSIDYKTALEITSSISYSEKLSPVTPSTKKAILLEEQFQYYKANKEKVEDDFWRALSDYPEDAVIAYYVLSLPLH